MRDDIQQLAGELLHFYEKKLTCLKQIHTSEVDKRYDLRTESFDELNEKISNDNHVIEIIDTLDVDIMNTIAMICAAAGIETSTFEKIFFNNSGDVVDKIRNIRKEIHSVLVSIKEERDFLIQEMQSRNDLLKSDIRTLHIYGKLKKD
ncbi:MAG TPA: hypothetical protein PLI62_16420 [Spirochaetota bacterium]|nr:hypothetical protein [Spirochaetota bacterium]